MVSQPLLGTDYRGALHQNSPNPQSLASPGSLHQNRQNPLSLGYPGHSARDEAPSGSLSNIL